VHEAEFAWLKNVHCTGYLEPKKPSLGFPKLKRLHKKTWYWYTITPKCALKNYHKK